LNPALFAICLTGYCIASLTIFTATCSSASSSLKSSNTLESCNNTLPHPATIHSSIAALVAFRASSILYFLFFISISVAAHTWITATHPTNLANLSINFSLS
jgi:hypothetical protein